MDTHGRQGPRARGWRQWTAERARRELEAWQASGEPLATYARRREYTPQRLQWWRARLAQWSGGGEGHGHARLIPVEAARPVGTDAVATVTLHLPGGIRAEIGDLASVPPEWLAALVRALGTEAA